MSIDRWMDKEDVVHIYSGILAIKKNAVMSFSATWMNLEIIILNEVNQKEKDKPYNFTFIWNLKYDTNQHIYETETYSQT